MKRELERIEIPEEHEARERAWRVVETAFAEREQQPQRRSWKPIAGVALAVAVVAGLLSPPGRAVLDEIREVVGVEQAQPALFSLPAPGRLLVTSDAGAWVVDRDGSKRLLGNYREASWSPFGRFVVASRQNELVALEPDGDVRWTLARPDVRFPRWGGSRTDTRIAYLSGGELRVVVGNGKGDRLLDSQAANEAPRWRAAPGIAWLTRDATARSVWSMPTRAPCSIATHRRRSRRPPIRQADPALAHRLLGGSFASAGPLARSSLARGRLARRGSVRLLADARPWTDPRGLGRLRAVPLALLPYDRGVVLHALIVAALLAAPAEQLGRSSEGRPIDVVHIAGAGQRILVVGCIHGDECEGIEVTKILAHSNPTADLWLVHQLNPDGYARRNRMNANGVDLNRDFLAASQRETRIARKLIRRVKPDVTLWFHQPQATVRAWGRSQTTARRYAQLAGVPYRSLPWPPGSASRWQNGLGQVSFVVELPAGELPDSAARRYAAAVLRLAE